MRTTSSSRPHTVLVTGGAGFIGSALVRHLLEATAHRVVTVDALTYAGDRRALGGALDDARHTFVQVDICDGRAMAGVVRHHRPDAVMHLAAESHVDRSIDAPAAFVRTNVVGTATLLDVMRGWRDEGESEEGGAADDGGVRFVHVSTDEVYGSLTAGGADRFHEATPYDPHSPYAASKAASDHMVRAWGHTYGLATIVTHSTNNYGPWQFPEKLIPVVVLRALAGQAIPVYGTGANVRDWLHVDDHARALAAVLERGRVGQTYDVGARCERTNLEVVRAICALLDEHRPRRDRASYLEQIVMVPDRPGHDLRYATDPTKVERELGWRPEVAFDVGLRSTIEWMLEHRELCEERLRRGAAAPSQSGGPRSAP